jgi:hypothetical protein
VACSIICAIVYITTTTLTQVYSRTFFSRSSPWPRETTYDVRGQESNQMAAQGSLLRSSTNVRIMTRWSPRERTPASSYESYTATARDAGVGEQNLLLLPRIQSRVLRPPGNTAAHRVVNKFLNKPSTRIRLEYF